MISAELAVAVHQQPVQARLAFAADVLLVAAKELDASAMTLPARDNATGVVGGVVAVYWGDDAQELMDLIDKWTGAKQGEARPLPVAQLMLELPKSANDDAEPGAQG